MKTYCTTKKTFKENVEKRIYKLLERTSPWTYLVEETLEDGSKRTILIQPN